MNNIFTLNFAPDDKAKDAGFPTANATFRDDMTIEFAFGDNAQPIVLTMQQTAIVASFHPKAVEVLKDVLARNANIAPTADDGGVAVVPAQPGGGSGFTPEAQVG